MSIEELRVITIVYVSALAPLVILFTHKQKIPSWAPILYLNSKSDPNLNAGVYKLWEGYFADAGISNVSLDIETNR